MKDKMHWKHLFDYPYLGAHSIYGMGDVDVTIDSIVKGVEVANNKGETEQCPAIKFREYEKIMILNRVNSRNIEKALKDPCPANWIGSRVTLYIKNNVAYMGDEVDALRVRPVAPPKVSKKKQDLQKKVRAAYTAYTGDDKKLLQKQMVEMSSKGQDDAIFLTMMLNKLTQNTIQNA